ncbi:uncharacterized protein LOC116991099 [Amblyraja radiata]|uniref:uncharacterized protein LOC116991099 n=1 Tax=Amblyraja radiata TaxID=386614 RepID=UPI0014037B65|nr:uncharacterized protein LOC116991099 [Amblyraja radiata]
MLWIWPDRLDKQKWSLLCRNITLVQRNKKTAGLHTAALCRAGTAAIAGSITTVPVGGTVRFPVLHHSQERFEVAMGRVHPDLAILAWKSDSLEYPYIVRPSYRDRVRFRRDTFIKLGAVRSGDQGTYEVQTNYLGRELRNRDRERFELRVVEPMSTPTVEVSYNSSHLTVNCSTFSGCLIIARGSTPAPTPTSQKIAAAAAQSLQCYTATHCPEGPGVVGRSFSPHSFSPRSFSPRSFSP